MSTRLIAFAIFTIYGSAQAQPATLPSTQRARGDTLVVSAVIDAPPDEIFDCFKTSQGVVKAWGVAQAKVDFRVGGEIRTAYAKETDLDSGKAIVNTIVAYVPGRMLVIKPTAPEGAPDWLAAICRDGWNVLQLDPLGTQRTRVTITGMGYGPGPLFDQAYSFFKEGDEWTLAKMQKSLGHPDLKAKSERAWAQLISRAGGDWIAEQTGADGAVFRARTHWETAMGGALIVARGWLGDASGMREHAMMLASVDPDSGAVHFDQFVEGGHAAQGEFVALDDDSVEMPLTIHAAGQKDLVRFAVMRFVDQDVYHFSVFATEKDARQRVNALVDVDYRRINDLPEQFRKMAAAK